jgi:serine/threonine-protein kinase PRP4
MASRRSSTASEGEIVESGSSSEKANPSQRFAKDTFVDRTSRRRASRSASPYSNHSSRRDEGRTRSRSRSPYRERSPRRDPRGSKRTREDDHYSRNERNDPRRFKVHYEEREYGGREHKGSGRSTFMDYDRQDASVHRLRYDDRDYDRPRDKRQRTLSRSPPRFSDRKGQRDGRSDTNIKQTSDRRDGNGRFHSEQSVSDDRANRGPKTALARPNAKGSDNQTSHGKSVAFRLDGKSDKYVPEMFLTRDTDRMCRGADANGATDPQAEKPEEPLDEAALIEQRRKRREAIKAKHRGQGTPLLVQALEISNASSGQGSVAVAARDRLHTPGKLLNQLSSSKLTIMAEGAKSTPPDSPREVSVPNSPSAFTVSNDAELANSNATKSGGEQEDGPSAADYDPTMDMAEDRMKQVSHHQNNDVPAGAYDETTNDNQDLLIPKESIEQDEPATAPEKDELDMFAEDDDMFAATSPTTKANGTGATQAVPVSKAKALDMSMLDDWDDHEGYYKIILGELLEGRYHVQLNLGRGMFSAVVRAMDEVTKKLVAIKIIRANDTMRKAAAKEIEILETLKDADPDDKKHMIRLERSFEHKGHLCMVFEHLSINLREVLKKFGRDVGINLKAVRAYAQQMFLGLTLMRKCNILHADLKPDNILVNESRNMLKICDLGSASDASDNEITPYLVSRFYRAPEIILGMPYDFAIDVWSVGCTLYELYTGKILFTGRSNNQMLRSIMECRGKFSHKVLRKAQFAHMHFDDLLNFRSVEQDKLTGKDTVRMLNLAKPTRDLRTRLMSNAKGMPDAEMKELASFVDLLDKCLGLNPEKRCTPMEALKHPFITKGKV